jgi:N-acetyl-1-D-myo-inositol-2-amino-2-deoxy-alpha-D-glucopyranoside deacetylase
MTEIQQLRPTFMAVHAHPDDEVFGTGGTFALLSERGYRTVLVTATLGEEGEIVDPDLDDAAKQAMFPRLAEVRREELRASVAALKISDSRILGYRDSGMAGTAANNHPQSFYQANFNEAVKRLVAIIREVRPQVIATYDAFGGYGHPDHVQSHRITVVAFDAAGDPRCFPELGSEAWQPRKLYYTAMPRSSIIQAVRAARAAGTPGPWDNPAMNFEVMGTADELITTRIDVRDYYENKMQAFRAHRTQIDMSGFLFNMPNDLRREAFGYEYFVLARSIPPNLAGVIEEHDLFAGLGL